MRTEEGSRCQGTVGGNSTPADFNREEGKEGTVQEAVATKEIIMQIFT
jgi:hypothetical protein